MVLSSLIAGWRALTGAKQPEEPKAPINHEDAGTAILEHLKRIGVVPPSATVRIIGPAGEPHPAEATGGEFVGWSKWQKAMEEMRRPGWATCRFVNRLAPDESIGWVYGIAKGSFGVWKQPYPVCHHPVDEHDEEFAPTAILPAITHLPSGMGIGIFNDVDVAIRAVDLIQPLGDWDAVSATTEGEMRDQWRSLMDRSYRTWEFNGIDYSMDWHAHAAPGTREIGIWTMRKETLEAGRPGKVS